MLLYTGVTNNVYKRSWQHKEGIGSTFTHKYNCSALIYFEEFQDINKAIAREKQIKNWKRECKLELIKAMNPDLKDLLEDI